MTVREAVSRVKGSLKETTKDSILTKRHVWSIIQSALRLLLHAEISSVVQQDLYTTQRFYPELTEEEGCIGCQGCRVKLDNLLYINSGPLIRRIGSEDGFTTFRLVSPSQYQVKTNLRDNKTQYAYISNGYLYFQKCLPCIVVEAMFETEGQSCSILDRVIPIPSHLQDRMIKIAMSELQVFISKPVDVTANGNPNQ